eukprot:Blabericola_migrator_1__2125@NODE_1587_length_4224_cov_18_054607_g1037_i0_p2_GENE_NODE_1587_length_4224_cov_18_054607_g1037_i0NODE_1587_length_4224_cov_18_054607_g1037_i0_p2_ORF_typecomplete_len388_score69_01DUF1744/PF08490_12/0_022PadR/PF03551_14/0_3PadR/PF03551_14/3_8e03_NODE_1587_length_4224_cov_18_054607_g1037_i029254088
MMGPDTQTTHSTEHLSYNPAVLHVFSSMRLVYFTILLLSLFSTDGLRIQAPSRSSKIPKSLLNELQSIRTKAKKILALDEKKLKRGHSHETLSWNDKMDISAVLDAQTLGDTLEHYYDHYLWLAATTSYLCGNSAAARDSICTKMRPIKPPKKVSSESELPRDLAAVWLQITNSWQRLSRAVQPADKALAQLELLSAIQNITVPMLTSKGEVGFFDLEPLASSSRGFDSTLRQMRLVTASRINSIAQECWHLAIMTMNGYQCREIQELTKWIQRHREYFYLPSLYRIIKALYKKAWVEGEDERPPGPLASRIGKLQKEFHRELGYDIIAKLTEGHPVWSGELIPKMLRLLLDTNQKDMASKLLECDIKADEWITSLKTPAKIPQNQG